MLTFACAGCGTTLPAADRADAAVQLPRGAGGRRHRSRPPADGRAIRGVPGRRGREPVHPLSGVPGGPRAGDRVGDERRGVRRAGPRPRSGDRRRRRHGIRRDAVLALARAGGEAGLRRRRNLGEGRDAERRGIAQGAAPDGRHALPAWWTRVGGAPARRTARRSRFPAAATPRWRPPSSARATGWPLDVFVPSSASDAILERLAQLSATVHVCTRTPGRARRSLPGGIPIGRRAGRRPVLLPGQRQRPDHRRRQDAGVGDDRRGAPAFAEAVADDPDRRDVPPGRRRRARERGHPGVRRRAGRRRHRAPAPALHRADAWAPTR